MHNSAISATMRYGSTKSSVGSLNCKCIQSRWAFWRAINPTTSSKWRIITWWFICGAARIKICWTIGRRTIWLWTLSSAKPVKLNKRSRVCWSHWVSLYWSLTKYRMQINPKQNFKKMLKLSISSIILDLSTLLTKSKKTPNLNYQDRAYWPRSANLIMTPT